MLNEKMRARADKATEDKMSETERQVTMWGPEIVLEQLKGSLWGPEISQQVQGDRVLGIARRTARAVSHVDLLGDIAQRTTQACIELEAYAEELMRQRDEAVARCEKLEVQARRYKTGVERRNETIRGLSLLRDHLEEEIGKFRSRCEKAEEWRVGWQQMRQERDWAGRQLLKLRKTIKFWKREEEMHVEELEDYRHKLTASEEKSITLESRNTNLLSQLADSTGLTLQLRQELATARNKALDEAMAICEAQALALDDAIGQGIPGARGQWARVYKVRLQIENLKAE